MIWDINTGYLEPLVKENPEEEVNPEGKDDSKGGTKDYGF